jgi:hypothetical protein
MENDHQKNAMEDDLPKKNGRRPQKNEKMKDDHKYNKKKINLNWL